MSTVHVVPHEWLGRPGDKTWAKLVTGVDLGKSGGYALLGHFVDLYEPISVNWGEFVVAYNSRWSDGIYLLYVCADGAVVDLDRHTDKLPLDIGGLGLSPHSRAEWQRSGLYRLAVMVWAHQNGRWSMEDRAMALRALDEPPKEPVPALDEYLREDDEVTA